MIIKIRVPHSLETAAASNQLLIRSRDNSSLQYVVDILETIPELTEKEALLSKVFEMQLSQPFKEIMAAIINKVYDEK